MKTFTDLVLLTDLWQKAHQSLRGITEKSYQSENIKISTIYNLNIIILTFRIKYSAYKNTIVIPLYVYRSIFYHHIKGWSSKVLRVLNEYCWNWNTCAHNFWQLKLVYWQRVQSMLIWNKIRYFQWCSYTVCIFCCLTCLISKRMNMT